MITTNDNVIADNVIAFQAIIARVQTLADGGLRVVLDMPEDAVNAASELIECKHSGAYLEIRAVPVLSKANQIIRDEEQP